jgi:hypothetical protein
MSAATYVVEVKAGGKVSVVRVLAISPSHAVAQAFEKCNVSARVVRAPAEHEGDS